MGLPPLEMTMTADYSSPGQGSPLSDLAFRLEYARENYTPDLSDHGRIAAKAALGACILFIKQAIPNGLDLVLPLRELLDGLDDLERNLTGPMLESRKKGGGHYIPRNIETFRAMAAVLMEINRRSRGRKAAAEKAAHDLSELGFRDERGDPISASRLEDWRDNIKREGNSLGAKRFWDYVTKLKIVDEERAYEEVLRSLRVIPGSRIPNSPPGNSEFVR
jgi:hypothetical protein